jgi:hypothetical protein
MADIASIAYVWVGSFFVVKWLFIIVTEVENSKLRSTDINENGDPKAAENRLYRILTLFISPE